MPALAVYDANVLYPNPLRDLLIRLARAGAVRARWTDQILDEMFAALHRTRPDIDTTKLDTLRQRMNGAVRDCLITDFEHHVHGLELPDPDDRHVLAAAIHSNADLIATWNLRDFPAKLLDQHGVHACTPDDFVHDLTLADQTTVITCVQQIADARLRRPQTADRRRHSRPTRTRWPGPIGCGTTHPPLKRSRPTTQQGIPSNRDTLNRS